MLYLLLIFNIYLLFIKSYLFLVGSNSPFPIPHSQFPIPHSPFPIPKSPMFQTTRRRLAIWYTAVTAVLLLLFATGFYRRLAIWYTAVTAVLLLVFATGFYFYVRNTLIERIDDTLNHVVEIVERTLVIEPLTSPITEATTKFQVNSCGR